MSEEVKQRITVYQTAGSNELLRTNLAKVPKLYLPTIDLFMSLYIAKNKYSRLEHGKALKAGIAHLWPYDRFQVDLMEQALNIVSNSWARPDKARRNWINATATICQKMVDSHTLLRSFTQIDRDTYIATYLNEWTDCITCDSMPSPLSLPASLYRFGKRGIQTVGDYAFRANRLLAVHAKMNEVGHDSFELSMERFCEITGIPKPRKWSERRAGYVDGPSEWEDRCLTRSFDPYGQFKATLNPNHKAVTVQVLDN